MDDDGTFHALGGTEKLCIRAVWYERITTKPFREPARSDCLQKKRVEWELLTRSRLLKTKPAWTSLCSLPKPVSVFVKWEVIGRLVECLDGP